MSNHRSRFPTNILPACALALALFPTLAHGQAAPEGSEQGSQSDQDSKKAQEETKEAQQDKRDKRNEELADRIKSVQRKVFLKKQRLEVFPFFGLDLNDPFYQHLLLGGSLSYHLVDSLAIEARGGFVFASIRQGSVKIVRQEIGAVLENVPALKGHADLDVTWAPLYGKISLLGEGILHFDTYLTGGPGIFITDIGVAPAVNIGIGQRYFITRWLDFRLELRNYLYVETRNEHSSVNNLLVLGFMLSGFFPTSFEYEFQ